MTTGTESDANRVHGGRTLDRSRPADPVGVTPSAPGSRHAERDWAVLVAFWLLAAFVGSVRAWVLHRGGAPATIDAGNFLAFGRDLLGADLRPVGIVYPPVVPLILAGAVEIMSPRLAVAIVGALASTMPGIGLFVLLRSASLRWSAVGLAALAMAGAFTGEATAWGGFPQLIALGLLPMCLGAVDRWCREPSLGRAWAAGSWLALIAATSHLVFAVATVSVAVVVLLRTTTSRPEEFAVRSLLPTSAVLAVPSLALLPVYVTLLNAFASSRAVLERPRPAGDMPAAVDFLFHDLTVPWRLAMVVAIAMPFALADRRRDMLWVVATPLLAVPALGALVLGEDRLLGALPLGVLLALAAWAKELTRHGDGILVAVRRGLAVMLAAGVVTQVALMPFTFAEQREFYGIVDPGVVAASDWLRQTTPPATVVAVPPVNNAPLGWWVEGLAQRVTLLGSPLRWLQDENERDRARLANAVFAPGFPSLEHLELARRAGAAYVLAPSRSELVDPTRIRSFVRAHPSLLVFEHRDVVILAVEPS